MTEGTFDANNVEKNIIYGIANGVTISNGYIGESAVRYQSSILIVLGDQNRGLQIHFAYDLSFLKIRSSWDTWRGWKTISLS